MARDRASGAWRGIVLFSIGSSCILVVVGKLPVSLTRRLHNLVMVDGTAVYKSDMACLNFVFGSHQQREDIDPGRAKGNG